jgi:hypothetical protein
MPQFQPAGAGFEQGRRQYEEVVATHERDLDVTVRAQESLEVACGCHAAESTANYDDTHAVLHRRT